MYAIIERELKELDVKPTSDQVRAGINMFDSFGVNNTLDALAGGDILKYDAVLEKDYNTVFLKLKRSKLETVFNRNYEKIRNERAESEARAKRRK